MKKNKIIINFIPYLLFIIVVILSSVDLFHQGILKGDDFSFHATSIYSIYDSLKNGESTLISNLLCSGLGYGTNLFYSPLSHYLPAFIA